MHSAPRPAPVSIVISLWNEADMIGPLVDRLAALADHPALRWKFVLTDDGSTDGTGEILRENLHRLPSWKLLQLSRTFGHTQRYPVRWAATGGVEGAMLNSVH